MMRRHFRDVHPRDFVEIPSKGFFPRCEWCGMQCNPSYPAHTNTKECRAGTECQHQRDMAIRSALALRQQFTIQDQVLERVDIFKSLGPLLSQDDDNVQAVRAQLCKARSTWARVSKLGTYFECRTRPQESVLCFTRRWSSRCCSTAARPGFSARR
jgi:hypothetical protein